MELKEYELEIGWKEWQIHGNGPNSLLIPSKNLILVMEMMGNVGWEMMVKLVPSKSSWWFQTFFSFTPKIGKMIQFDEHIFQMG